jgi:hypothetical protein
MAGHTERYSVWSADYYDSASQMFPRDDQIHGPIDATDEADLARQLQARGLNHAELRWEVQS